MKLTSAEKTTEMLNTLRGVSDQCFNIDSPPESEFSWRFEAGDVFILRFDPMLGIGFGPVVAYAICTPMNFLWQIATFPPYRGRGFATDLLKEIFEEYKGDIELTVRLDNATAQMLYLKNGFRVVSVLRKYFPPEDGLLMRRVHVP